MNVKTTKAQLEQIVREWREAFDNIPDFVSIHDLNYKIIRANRALSDALKMKPQDVIGKRCYELFHKSHAPCTHCPHQRTIESRVMSREEFYEPVFDHYLEVITAPIFDEYGQLTGSIHIARNITQRKLMEVNLKSNEERLDLALKGTQEGVWDWNLETNAVWFSPRYKG